MGDEEIVRGVKRKNSAELWEESRLDYMGKRQV
jgi:hypothetical protein